MPRAFDVSAETLQDLDVSAETLLNLDVSAEIPSAFDVSAETLPGILRASRRAAAPTP